ncbi:HEPN domain-containing protein [Methanogenium organophilum]|uniref:HEPN domain-containing protein n=1 Tax=Methanogenium organophilum TaxID=2199 RepID=A0A9X9S205_METOG|nr:HEPN domain-containing protein [Methanogenium organophilum]WAI00393.1 HEPN domain-containing protein [Methanogenium organophilum]
MSFQWSHYIGIARFLLRNIDDINEEAAYRSAISRAYYAAFCHAKYYAKDNSGFIPENTADDHLILREHFRTSGKSDIVRSLQRLREWRNSSDYNDPSYKANEQIARQAIRQAETVINKLN